MTRNDILNNIKKQINIWKSVRINKPLFVNLPKEKYGSEHYIYYYFQDILPKHKVIKDDYLIGNNIEVLYLNDIMLDSDDLKLISVETITIITSVISKEYMEKLKEYHINQNLNLYFEKEVRRLEYFNKMVLEKFYEYIVGDSFEIFYPVCLIYKKIHIYNFVKIEDDDFHKSLDKNFINIYEDIKRVKQSNRFNDFDLETLLGNLIRYKNIPFCSTKYHSISINFKDDYMDLDYRFTMKDIEIDKNESLSEDIDSDSSIILVNIFLYEVGFNHGHANLVIINKFLKTFEVFEPHGTGYDDRNLRCINNIIAIIIASYIPNYKYIQTSDFCFIGPQIKTGIYFEHDFNGICLILCVLYGYLRVLNPDFSQYDIIKEIDHMISYPDFGITLRKFNSLLKSV